MKKTLVFLAISSISISSFAASQKDYKCSQAEGERKFYSNIQSNIKDPTTKMDYAGVPAKRDGLKCEGGWGKDGKQLPKENDNEKTTRELKERKCSILDRQYDEKKDDNSFAKKRIIENMKETGCKIPEEKNIEEPKKKDVHPEPVQTPKEEIKKVEIPKITEPAKTEIKTEKKIEVLKPADPVKTEVKTTVSSAQEKPITMSPVENKKNENIKQVETVKQEVKSEKTIPVQAKKEIAAPVVTPTPISTPVTIVNKTKEIENKTIETEKTKNLKYDNSSIPKAVFGE